jgi:antitoxin VapB
MKTTKLFVNGNSQAVRIPADMAYDQTNMKLEIERVGNELRIRPASRTLEGVLKKFAKFGSDVMAQGREDHEQKEREKI